MKTFTIIILFLLCAGVFGAEVKSVSVMEGDSVTLHTDLTEIKTGDLVWWRFKKGDSKDLLAEIGKNKIWYGESFKDKLLTDGKTGDLNITNMKIKYSGLYEAEINSGTGTSYKRFNVTVNESPLVSNAEMSVVKSVSVTEGESVTLQTDVKLQTDDLILWRFGDQSVLIAKGDMEDNKISVYDDDDGSFGDRLMLNDQTGDLIITNSKSKHSGVYQLKISRNKQTFYKTFSVIVRGAGSSSGVIAGLCVFFLLVIAAVIAAGLILYRHKISKLKLLVPVDEQKSLVPRSEMEAEMRDDELKEVTYKGHGNSQKPQNSYEVKSVSVMKGDQADVDVIDEVKSGSVKGVQAVTYTVNENTQKPQNSVCAADINEEMIRTGKLGESVTLDTCVAEIQRDDEILWMFEDTTIAQYTGGKDKPTLNKTDERFKDKLEMNSQTGDLTINRIIHEVTGVYKVQIKNSSGNKERKFGVALYVQHTKGKCNTLCTKVKINEGDKVEWTSKDKTSLVTGMNGDDSKTSYTDDERFRDRLKMTAQTGDLLIRDIRQTEVYTLKLIKSDGKITNRIFNVDLLGYCVKGSLNYTSQRERDKASQNLLKPQNSDGQKSLVQSSEMEAEMRDDEFKEGTNKVDENSLKQQKSDEVKSVSVKGDQADGQKGFVQSRVNEAERRDKEVKEETNKSNLKTKKQQKSETDKIDKKPLKQQNSVCAADINEEMIRTGKLGGSVTLDTCVTEIQRDDEILWMFEDMTIAQYTGGTNTYTLYTDERFKDKLEMNHQTGDLTIKNMRSELTGVYKVQIKNSSGTKERKFIVAFSVEDMKGGLVTPSESKKKEGDEVEQTSEDKTPLVTGMNEESSNTSYTDDNKDRQQMNRETKDPSITDTSEKDKGVFTPQLINTDGDVNETDKIDKKPLKQQNSDSADIRDEAVPLLDKAYISSPSIV